MIFKGHTIDSERASMLGSSFDCACGKRHAIPVKRVILSKGALASLGDDLKFVLIVSKVTYAEGEGRPEVTRAAGTKCPRCWNYCEQPDEDGLCPRCHRVMHAE